ncbi:MAG: hypothetical protein ACETVQ_02440 [Candidatus Bathyarchaeia archaeon]
MKKIFALALPLMFFSLMSISMAETTPVRVKRVKDVCFIRVWGDHQTKRFMFHYDNLSPNSQTVYAEFKPQSRLWFAIDVTVIEGGSMDVTLTSDYGMTMNFQIEVDGEKILEDTVVIPPPRWKS